MLHGVLPNEVLPFGTGAFLDPAWSVSLEWQFYLVAPLCFACATRYRSGFLWLSGLALLGPALARAVGTYDFPAFLPAKVRFFWLGGASYFLVSRVMPRVRVPASGDVFLVGVTGFLVFFTRNQPAFWPSLIWGTCLGFLVSSALPSKGLLTHAGQLVLRSEALQVLGRVSYVTYLVHLPLVVAMRYSLQSLAPCADKRLVAVQLALATVPLVLLCSLVVSEHVEQPGIRLGKRLASKWSLGTNAAMVPLEHGGVRHPRCGPMREA